MKPNWIRIALVATALTLAVWGCDSPTGPERTTRDQTVIDPPPPPPPPPPPKPVYQEVKVAGGTIRGLCPTWTRGDREFGGHGPLVRVEAVLDQVSQTEMTLKIWFSATETQSDWTAASGYWKFPKYIAPVGWVIDAILTANNVVITYTDRNHSYDYPTLPVSSYITYLKVMGDTDGNDVGDCTTDDTHIAELSYLPVTIRLRKL